MRKPTRILSIVFFFILLLIASAVIFQFRKNPKAVQDMPKISIRNRTSSIEITKQEYVNRDLNLTIRNKGALPIIAIGLAAQNEGYTTVDFSLTESIGRNLAPGASADIHLSISKNNPIEVNASIDMAYFIDGSGDGDAAKIEEQRDIYEGVNLSLEEVSKEFKTHAKFDKNAIENARGKITSISPPPDLGGNKKLGFHSGINRAQSMINDLLRQSESFSTDKMDESFNKMKKEMSTPKQTGRKI